MWLSSGASPKIDFFFYFFSLFFGFLKNQEPTVMSILHHYRYATVGLKSDSERFFF